ncbi:MAG: GGDEF domain-containing protein [Nocardioides sp.]
MDLSTTAARVMTMAQHEDVEAALVLARRALLVVESDPAAVSPFDLAGLWYAIGVAEHVRADSGAQIEAADHCLAAARAAESPGWVSNALSVRAVAHVRKGAIELALLDLARAEVALDDCDDVGLRNWAHTGLGMGYSLLRLYELCGPHFEQALENDASPLPIAHSRVVDLLNLSETHLRWADELERALPYEGSDDDVEVHRKVGHDYAVLAEAEARIDSPEGLLASTRALVLTSRPRRAAAATVSELRAELNGTRHLAHLGDRAVLGAALARSLWRSGEREEALAEAARAAESADEAADWQVAASVRWLQVEMQASAGVPGAQAGREYARLLSRVLWQQRLSTLQGATAALDVERLRHTALAAERAAHEDPLTGVGNRRALDQALRELDIRHAAPDQGPRTSLLVVDLDRFKAVNDTHGHVVGDAVLRAVADTLRSVARAEDVVARLGGDEFVLLAHGTDEVTGRRLADRVSRAIGEVEVATPSGPLRLAASVGVATTGPQVEAGQLLSAADAAMYGAKDRTRRRTSEEVDGASWA